MGTGDVTSRANITELLHAWSGGDDDALHALTPFVYDHLHRLARQIMAGERPDHTLQTTALVNEAYSRLIDSRRADFRDRAHFFALAARLMRRILVDFARSRQSKKRLGRGSTRVALDEAKGVSTAPDPDLVELDEALNQLARMDPRKAQVVELRFFGGLDEKEVAEALHVSTDTVQRDWKAARAWLFTRLTG